MDRLVDARTMKERACRQIARAEFARASVSCSRGLHLDPEDINISVIIAAFRNDDKSLRIIDKSLRINPRSRQAYHTKARLLYKLDRYEEALRSLDEAFQLHDRHFPCSTLYSLKGKVLSALGQYKKAVKYFDQSLLLNPAQKELHTKKGDVFLILRRPFDAIRCYDKAILMDTTNLRPYIGKARALISLDDKLQALECFDKAIDIDPNHPDAYLGKAFVLMEVGSHEEALVYVEKTLRLEVTCVALYTKASALMRLKRFEEALLFYEQCEDDLKSPFVPFEKGLTLQSLGKLNKAIECFDQALSLNPDFQGALEAKEEILHLRRSKRFLCFWTCFSLLTLGVAVLLVYFRLYQSIVL